MASRFRHDSAWIGALKSALLYSSRHGGTLLEPDSRFDSQASHPGRTLIELPRACQLTLDEATDPRVTALVAKVPEQLWGGRLALQLLVHRALGDASPFAPYVNALPVGVAGLPLFFSGEAIDALQVRCAPGVDTK